MSSSTLLERVRGSAFGPERFRGFVSVLERYRRPAYTGENRCLPCTVANVAIGALVAVAITVLGRRFVDTTAAVALGALTLVGSLFAIALRGYLVPGTPRLTERYLPDGIRRRFHDRPQGIDDESLALAMEGVGASRGRSRN
ncbi:hypothetical protein [Halopiger goleimassiliensis]|uniref:hypothetical protein n=1 Tax=Halopiger goleimassiliensis TaxID=1293048 RepID=UPI000AD6142E|nr:hypothetical protein [Halopiger goleimassiliensis]